ncbi:MAG: septum formation protein Maf [Alphaproteobacteria bacterium]|nr:septum formation protein Maf [Alphaproteobacteria bacterium]
MTASLILASASPRRLALLAQIGITPSRVEPADIDETATAQELPRPHALRIATAKARTVHARAPGAVILAADTVVACGRRILPKAEDDATVTKCLAILSGRRHTVITAVAIVDIAGKLKNRIVETKVAFRRLDAQEIAAYVQSAEGLGKAGGYAIQGRAAAFVRAINGSYTNVVGLPLTETLHMLKACGAA